MTLDSCAQYAHFDQSETFMPRTHEGSCLVPTVQRAARRISLRAIISVFVLSRACRLCYSSQAHSYCCYRSQRCARRVAVSKSLPSSLPYLIVTSPNWITPARPSPHPPPRNPEMLRNEPRKQLPQKKEKKRKKTAKMSSSIWGWKSKQTR